MDFHLIGWLNFSFLFPGGPFVCPAVVQTLPLYNMKYAFDLVMVSAHAVNRNKKKDQNFPFMDRNFLLFVEEKENR